MKHSGLTAATLAFLLSFGAIAQEQGAPDSPTTNESAANEDTVTEEAPANPFGCNKPPLPNRSPDFLDCKLDVGMTKKQVKQILGAPFMSAKGMGGDTVNHYWCAAVDDKKVRCLVIFDKTKGAYKWRTYIES